MEYDSCLNDGSIYKDPNETLSIDFDFSQRLSTGETISSLVSVEIFVVGGEDTNASAIISSYTPTLNATTNTVTQYVTGGVSGVIYRLIALVSTSDNQQLGLGRTLQIQMA